jgi:hypothetical protein
MPVALVRWAKSHFTTGKYQTLHRTPSGVVGRGPLGQQSCGDLASGCSRTLPRTTPGKKDSVSQCNPSRQERRLHLSQIPDQVRLYCAELDAVEIAHSQAHHPRMAPELAWMDGELLWKDPLYTMLEWSDCAPSNHAATYHNSGGNGFMPSQLYTLSTDNQNLPQDGMLTAPPRLPKTTHKVGHLFTSLGGLTDLP